LHKKLAEAFALYHELFSKTVFRSFYILSKIYARPVGLFFDKNIF
jgi:hypothetical protein